MELNTDLTMTSGNTDYRGDIMMSTQDLGIVANRSVVQFKTDLTITSFSDDTLVSEMKTDLIFSNNTMMFSVIDYAEVRKSILYFSKFFNVNFEEAYLWKMLASGTSEQINKSHLADVYTAINNLAAKLNNFLEGTDSDNIINTWKELQEFLKGITGVQDLYSLIKSMVTYENIMPLIQDHFLRKDKDDTTAYNLTFANSAKGAGITLGDKFEPGVTGGRINAYYDRNNTLQTSVEVDYLTVRKKATFTQLTIEELKSVGGSIILSPAAMECSRVEILTLQQSDIDAITQGNKYLDSETGEYKTYCQVGDIVFRCYFTKEDEDGTEIINQFVAGDQAKCQTFNASNIYDYTDTSDLSGNRYYWRLVVNTGEDFIDLSQNDKDTGSDVPVLGDTIVQLGHRHDPTRQAAQIISAYGSDAPSHRMYQGVGTTMYFASNVEGEAGYTSGPYDLYGKDVYGLYYNVDSATPGNSKMMQYTYGDWYVGTRNRNHRDSDTTYIKFDTEKKQLSLRGVLVQSQYGDEPQPIEYYRGTYTLENPNCDLFPYYWMDTVTYVSPDGIVGTYIHTGKTTTIGVRPDDTSVWTPKVLGSRGESAITFDLSNEIDAVALDSGGKTLGDETLETTINFHVGLTKISPLKSVSYTLPTGWVDLTDKTTYLTTGKLSFKILQGTVVSNRVIVDITVSITYNSIDYTDTKTYTLTGVEGGANVKLYSLSLSDSVVAYNPNSGVYTPEQITITKKVREGGSAPLSTKEGKVLCEFLMPDGSTTTEQINEITESKIIDVNKEFTKLVVSYYVSNGGTYVRQDQETVPFLREGKDSSLKPYLSYYFAYSSQSVSSTFTTPPKDLDVWTEERHPYWYDTPPEYPLPQTETGGINYYLWMCVVYYKVNSTNTGWEVDTADHPVTYKRVEGEAGPSGPDGTKSPYTEYSFAYSTDLNTASSTTEPAISGSWNDGTPERPSDYDTVKYYLWMKVQKMKATIDNSGWEKDGLPTYARVDGEKGEKGDPGDKGDPGSTGNTPYVGNNGNWWIADVDTGVRAGGTDGKDGKDGKGSYVLSLTCDSAVVGADTEGNIISGTEMPSCTAALYYGDEIVSSVTYSISTTASGVSINSSTGVLTFSKNFTFSGRTTKITVRASLSGTVKAVKIMTVTKSIDGKDGHSPYVGDNGNWYFWDVNNNKFKDSGLKATGDDGHSPYVGSNGNWYEWDSTANQYKDTGIPAEGSDGHSPYIGTNGNWFIWDEEQNKYVDSGIPAKGVDGSSNKIADLTNDADYIMVGSDGILNNLDSAITVTTTAILYDGTDPMILKDCIIDTSELPSNITFTKSFSSDKKQCIITGTLTNGTEVLKDEYKIPVTLLGDDTAGTSRLCTYTLAFVKKGADGEAYNIVPSVNNIKYYVETGTFSNSTLTCKVYKKSGKQAYKEITGGVSLMYYVDSDTKAYTYDLVTQTSLYPSIAQTDIIHFYDHVKFVLLYEGAIIDTETVYIVKDGKDGKSAYNLTLTNDNASINADSEGNILAGAIRPECTAKLYYGTTEVTDAIYSLSTTATGVSINTSTGTLTFSSDFNFSGTSVEIIVSASLDGNVLATKTMTVSKSMAGTDGQDAVSYWLVLNYSSCIYNQNDGTVNPSTLTAKAYKQVGENPVVEITNPDIVYTYISRGDNVESSEHDYSNSLTVTKNDCLSYCKIKFSLKVNGNVVDFEDVDLLKDGKNGGDGSDGDSVMLAYRNSPKMPDTPAQGTAYPPEGWRRTVAVSGTYLVEVVTTQTLSGKSTKDFTLTRVTDKTSAYYGYYQIQGSEAHNTLQCVKVSVKSSGLSAYNVDVNVKTNNEDGSDWAYVGKLDMDVSTATTEVTGRVSGQSGNKTFTLNVKDKSTHSFYIYYVKDLSISKYTDSVYFKISSSTSENFVEEGTLYSCTGYKNGKTGIITWDTPVLSDYGESPIYSYCGDWVSTQQYWGNNEMIHIVSVAKYTTNGTLDSRTYYKAVRGAGNIPIGVAPESVQVYKYLDITTYTTIEGTTTESTSRYNRSDTTKDITITVDEVSTAYYSWICGDTVLYTKVASGVLGIKLYTYDSSTTTMTELDTKVKRVTSYGDPYFGATYWVKISQYSSMATNLLLADTAILDKATVRSLLTADSPEARIDIRENKLSLYSKDNLERLTIIGDNISGTGTPQYYNVDTTKTTTIKGPASGTESWSVVSFVVNTDNTKVTIPTIEFGWDALVQGDGGSISYNSLVRIELTDGTATYKSVETVSAGSLGTTSVLLSTFSINLNAGTYYVKVSAVYDIEPQEIGSIAITTYTKAQEPVVVSINSASDNKISIGANGLVANLGNDFSVQMLKENGESKIILLGANTSGNAVGIKISSAGVEYSQNNDWQLLSSGGGSSSSSGNVSAGASLTSGGIILGNGGYNVKPSSYIPSKTWIDNSEVVLPSCKAIEDYVKNNSGSSPSGLTSVGLSVPTGLTITGSPLTSNGTLKVTYSSGYSIPKTSDVDKGVEAYDNQYMMLAAPPVLQVIRTYNYSNVKEEFLRVFHPLLANHEYSAVLMVYSKNKKFIRRDSSGTAYYKRKRGWSLALGDFMASYSHYPLEVLGGLSEGIVEITLDELRNHIIPRYAEWQGVDTTTMTYSVWTADSTTTARGFSSGYAEHKKFGVAIRKTNPEFTAIATASTLKDNTMSLQDSSGRIVYRYLYSAVAPLDAYFSSDSRTQNKRYLYFGVACK